MNKKQREVEYHMQQIEHPSSAIDAGNGTPLSIFATTIAEEDKKASIRRARKPRTYKSPKSKAYIRREEAAFKKYGKMAPCMKCRDEMIYDPLHRRCRYCLDDQEVMRKTHKMHLPR